MGISRKDIFDVFCIGLLVKVLLIPAYFSTDFDVHRNWLRITHNHPLQHWYVDVTTFYTQDRSVWTLDYPPFFAYFEWVIGLPARWLCPDILSEGQLECHTMGCVLYQRITVIVSELVYLFSLVYALRGRSHSTKMFAALFLQFGFVLLDDIHFQYNSMMQGLLIFSIQLMIEGNVLVSALLFSVLLNFKHIYLYVAPVYFLYILGAYVKTNLKRLLHVAALTLLPFALSFGPFVLKGGLSQIGIIMARLFPFQRGLVHAYWAPNFWAAYYFLDRVLGSLGFAQRLPEPGVAYSSSLKVLPNVTAGVTLLIILLVSLPIYIRTFLNALRCQSQELVQKASRKLIGPFEAFVQPLILSGLLFFFFGYHAHQKAITIYVNLALLFYGSALWPDVLVNSINLLPLLIDLKEKYAKLGLLAIYMGFWGEAHWKKPKSLLVLATGILVVLFHDMVHPFLGGRMEFMPLMLNSLWATAFNSWLIARLYVSTWKSAGLPVQNDSF